ncbi:ankyrin-1-like [Trichogramma pretiosum]|uniref:ankyrin-1-like n=1 Tax=Trichogramma pretiosum TaxID=7493 RepID=UPI0006C96019|nr:ankyrin-1-like [Trichogramma pretiosum]
MVRSKILEKLTNLLENLNLESESDRWEFLCQLEDLISKWKSQPLSLREICRPEDIERLLWDSIYYKQINRKAKFIRFVARGGYKNEPNVDADGNPLVQRTTPLHRAAANENLDDKIAVLNDLFEIYNNVNYINEAGLTHFQVACNYGCDVAVQKFLEFGQDPSGPFIENGDSLLHVAMKQGHAKVAEALLRKGANPNVTNRQAQTPLHIACARKENAYALSKLLLNICYDMETRVDVDAQDMNRCTPLHLALLKDDRKTAQLLLRRVANPNLTNARGTTALHLICNASGDDEGLLKTLLAVNEVHNRNVLINAPDTGGRTALHFALFRNNKKLVKLLLKNGADPTMIDKEGWTTLHILCEKKNDGDELLKTLFELTDSQRQLAQINIVNRSGSAPLHLAAHNCNRKMCNFLLKNGANPNKTNENGLTPLHIISQKCLNGDLTLKRFFKMCDKYKRTDMEFDAEIEVDTADKEGNTPLHFAILYNNKEATKTLLRRGANHQAANKEGSTPLHLISSISNCVELMDTLFKEVRRRVDVDAQDSKGNTALHLAMLHNNEKATELLLRRGACPFSTNAEGSTPLHLICNGGPDNITLLRTFFNVNQEQGCPVLIDLRDKRRRTPLQLAVANCMPNAVHALLYHGANLANYVFVAPLRYSTVQRNHESRHNYKLRLASGIMAIAESLEKKGYVFERSDALAIMEVFVEHEIFESSAVAVKRLCADESFASQAQKIMISAGWPLHKLIQLEPDKAAGLHTHAEYHKFASSEKLSRFLEARHEEVCALRMCETTTRRFFLRWALECFMELTKNRLPTECSEMVIKNLTNQDLYKICLACSGK